MKILMIAAVVLVGIIVVSASTRRKETFNTLDAVVEDTRERFERGEFDD